MKREKGQDKEEDEEREEGAQDSVARNRRGSQRGHRVTDCACIREGRGSRWQGFDHRGGKGLCHDHGHSLFHTKRVLAPHTAHGTMPMETMSTGGEPVTLRVE